MAKKGARRQGSGKRSATSQMVAQATRKRELAEGVLRRRATEVHGPKKGDGSERRDGKRQCREAWRVQGPPGPCSVVVGPRPPAGPDACPACCGPVSCGPV